jgi:mRNA interferase MazF
MHRTHAALELFDEWNIQKQELHQNPQIEELFINPRDVWYIKMGVNIGNEQNGKGQFRRPVLVIRRIGNMYFCIPLTTQGKEDNFFYIPLKTVFENKKSWIIVSQGRVYDKKRFVELVGSIEPQEFYDIKKSLKKMYF